MYFNENSVSELWKDTEIELMTAQEEERGISGIKLIIIGALAFALAICVYHLRDDIYSIYELVKSYRNDYKVYLRHYTDSSSETVMYFIPNS